MKKLFTVIALLSAALTLKAGTLNPPRCTNGSLAAWESMTSCSFQDDFVLSNFSSSGDIPALDIQVSTAGWGKGLYFNADWTASGSGQLSSSISYNIFVTKSFLLSFGLTWQGVAVTGLPQGGMTLQVGSFLPPESLSFLFWISTGEENNTLGWTGDLGTSVNITESLDINANGGSATVTGLENDLEDEIAPESSEVWYFGIGLALLALGKRLQRA